MSKKRILIVEDERDMANLVASRLKREGYTVEVSHNGTEGYRRACAQPPDLLLLDLMLPGMSGTDIAAKLRDDPRTATIPIIMVTAKSEESDVVVGLRFGADDYVTKPFSMSVLIARIDALFRRTTTGAPSSTCELRAGPLLIDQQRYTVKLDGQSLALTLTEFKLLSALIAARGRVLTRNQLMDRVIGMDAVVTERTIDVHVTSLRHKLGPMRNFVQTVRGVGYRFETDAVAGPSL